MDNIQVVLASANIAVRLSPVKNLLLSQEDAQQADEIRSVSSRESKTKIMGELLSRYDNIIDRLIHDKPRNNDAKTGNLYDNIIDHLIHDKPRNNDAKTGNSTEMEAVLSELQEQRGYAMKLKSREGERQDSRESSSPPRPTERAETNVIVTNQIKTRSRVFVKYS